MKQMKRLCLNFKHIAMLFLLISITSSLSAGEWKLIKSENSVDFYYKISECQNNQVLVIKAVSENLETVKFKWNSKIKFDGYEDTSNNFIYELEAGVTAIGDCQDENLNALSRFVNIPLSNEKIEIAIEIMD